MEKETTDEELLKQLKDLLFEEEHRQHEKIKQEVSHINEEINDPAKLAEYVNPIIDEKLNYMREHFPELYGEVITKAIKKQITESQDDVIDALYPIIGKLIKKFIVKEFEQLSERVDTRMKETFSFKRFKSKLRYWVSGVNEKDALLTGMLNPQIEEAFVIDKKSGLLIGSYSRRGTIDQDMIAGMLTAIKSFVEDAFSKGGESLENIEYETYKILIQNFQSYYIAVVVSGSVIGKFKAELTDNIFEFAQKNKLTGLSNIDSDIVKLVSENLKKHFEPRQKINQ